MNVEKKVLEIFLVLVWREGVLFPSCCKKKKKNVGLRETDFLPTGWLSRNRSILMSFTFSSSSELQYTLGSIDTWHDNTLILEGI